jgi:hypothetical protein
MKMKNDHYAPLAKQTLAILRELQTINGADPESYVFAAYNPGKHISENSMIYALYRLDNRSWLPQLTP